MEPMEPTAPTETRTPQQTPRAHVLLVRPHVTLDHLTYARSRALVAGQTEAGRTEHVIVYTDGTPQGDATAQAVLQTAEADYLATQEWFGGIALPPGQEGDDRTTPRTATPIQVLMDAQAGGAYHFGCNATDLYLEPTPELASGLFVAELVEVFEAAINNGWDCGFTNGEGLSRVLAGERNAHLGSLFVQTEQAWWSDGHADYVSDDSADDANQDANGCATLFLYYLHTQLGYDWRAIVTTGGGALAETYQKLTGQDPASGFTDFLARLATLEQGGVLNVPGSGNPFPISGTAPIPMPQGSTQPDQQPAPVPAAGGAVLVEREIDVIAVVPPGADTADGAPQVYVVEETTLVTASAPTADGAAPGGGDGTPPPPPPSQTAAPPAAALDRTAPIRPRGLDAPAGAGQGGGGGRTTIGVLAVVIVLLALLAVLFISGVIHP